MTGKPARTAARGWVTRVLLGVLVVAALVPAMSSGAQASTGARARADSGPPGAVTTEDHATAPGKPPETSVTAPESSPALADDPETLIAEIQEFSDQVGEMMDQRDRLAAEYEKETQQVDSHNKSVDAFNKEADSFNKKSSEVESEAETVGSEIDAHNADAPDPEDEAAVAAYNAEADELNAKKSEVEAEENTLTAEQSKLESQQTRLNDEAEAIDSAIATYNDAVASLESQAEQLEDKGQQLLEQETQAEENLAANPPDPGAMMDAGGDASAPPQGAGRSEGQGADDTGGDSPSRQQQGSSVRQYGQQNQVPVETDPGTAELTPSAVSRLPASQAAQLGSPTGTYDGLAREPNGNYKALQVRPPGTTVSPGQEAFENALEHGGRAEARVGGRTIVISGNDDIAPTEDTTGEPQPAPSPEPPGADTRRPEHNNCLDHVPPGAKKPGPEGDAEGTGKPWIKNNSKEVVERNQTGADNGQGWRAATGIACLTSSERGTPAYRPRNGAQDITGWEDAENAVRDTNGKVPPSTIARCHVIASAVGGRGKTKSDWNNLFPCFQNGLNQKGVSMRQYESKVQAALDGNILNPGEAIYYVVTPHYDNDRSTIPDWVTITADIELPDGTPEPLFDPSPPLLNMPANGKWPNLGN